MEPKHKFVISYANRIVSDADDILRNRFNFMVELINAISKGDLSKISDKTFYNLGAIADALYDVISTDFKDKCILTFKGKNDTNTVVLRVGNEYLMVYGYRHGYNHILKIIKHKTKIMRCLLWIFYEIQKKNKDLELPDTISIESLCDIIMKYEAFGKI